MLYKGSKQEVVQVIREVLSDQEAEILNVFITGLQAARTVKDYPPGQKRKPPTEQSA